MHAPDGEQRVAAVDIANWAMDRLADRSTTFRSETYPWPEVGLPRLGREGVGTGRAWSALRDLVLPGAIPTDHPRYLAFVAGAASVSAVLADMAVSAAGIYAGSELEGGSVVVAERAALRWLSDVLGLPPEAHGAFVSGGSMANLSALVVARNAGDRRVGRPTRIVAGANAHASIDAAAEVMGCEVTRVGEFDEPMDAGQLDKVLNKLELTDVVGVVATAGATNTGAVDDLAGAAEVCAEHGVWLHVDAAYGGAAMLSDRCRSRFDGIQNADSVTIDPHKWLFTPFDCAAVVYRNPELARRTHAQTAPYLEAVNASHHDNPADYALHLSRRARGLPLWMSLLAHGTDAYRDAVDSCLDLAEYAVQRIRRSSRLSVVGDPTLSVVLFRREAWTRQDYVRWSQRARRERLALITPTTAFGDAALRLCFVNPQTTQADVDRILDDVETYES